MVSVFDPDLMRLITKIDELITDVSVEIVETEKKLLSKRFKDKEELTEKLHEKKERYHNLSFILGDLEKIGVLSSGTEKEISLIPKIIKVAKKLSFF